MQRSDIKGNALTHGGHCAIREPVRSAPAPAPAPAAAVLPAAACRGVASRRRVCCGGAVRYRHIDEAVGEQREVVRACARAGRGRLGPRARTDRAAGTRLEAHNAGSTMRGPQCGVARARQVPCASTPRQAGAGGTALRQKHDPGPKIAQAQTVEKGETAATVRRQHWAPGRRMR